jgi:hypothetical protein
MFQKGTNWADGGAFVNQCPIAPGAYIYFGLRLISTLTLTKAMHSSTDLAQESRRVLSGIILIFTRNTATGCEVPWCVEYHGGS